MNNTSKNITKEEINRLASKFAQGDPEAFKMLYDHYNKKIYRFCYRMLGDTELAKDAFQEIFVKIYEHRSSYNGTNFENWLYTTSRNTCINYIRRRKFHQSIEEIEIGFQPRKHLEIGIKEHIEIVLQKLPFALKEAFVLRDMEDLTYEQIAKVLNIDLSLAKVRVHRARLKLKELLQPLLREINETL